MASLRRNSFTFLNATDEARRNEDLPFQLRPIHGEAVFPVMRNEYFPRQMQN
jgi:hypothetical protein